MAGQFGFDTRAGTWPPNPQPRFRTPWNCTFPTSNLPSAPPPTTQALTWDSGQAWDSPIKWDTPPP